jgi:hypothetical protein
VHVAITEFTLWNWPWDAELESKRIFALEKTHLLDRTSVEFGKRSWIQGSGVLHTPIARQVGEHNVERKHERTRILAPNQSCDIS